jgi:hypothetical protein
MNQTEDPFFRREANSTRAIVAGVTAIAALLVYFLIFSGGAFVTYAAGLTSKGHLPALIALLAAGGLAGAWAAVRWYETARGRYYLAGGFAVCGLIALLALLAKSSVTVFILAAPLGMGTVWTMVALSMCLRPTLHFSRLGMWCGLGAGIAYALCNMPFVYEAPHTEKFVMAVVVAALGCVAAPWMRSSPTRQSSLPDYEFSAAAGWVVALFAIVALDTVISFIVQNSATLRQLSWETPVILLGNAFVHLCAAFLAGLVLDQRRAGLATLAALLLLLASSIVLQMEVNDFPKARMLSIAGISIYMAVLVYVPARGGRIQFSAIVSALSVWAATVLASGSAAIVDARKVPVWMMVIVLVVGLSALFARFLWLRRAEQIESERLVRRSA